MQKVSEARSQAFVSNASAMISVRLCWCPSAEGLVLGGPDFSLRVLGNLTFAVSPFGEQAVTHDWSCSLSWEETSFISFWRPMCHLLCLSCCPGFLFGSPWIQCLPGPALVSFCLREGEEFGREGEPPWQGRWQFARVLCCCCSRSAFPGGRAGLAAGSVEVIRCLAYLPPAELRRAKAPVSLAVEDRARVPCYRLWWMEIFI